MSRALGGYVGHVPTPSVSVAPGVWTLREASRYRRAGTWPAGIGTDPYFANVSLLLHMDGSGTTFIDSSLSQKTITAIGDATQSSAQSKWGGKSAYFDGAGDYLTSPINSDVEFGTGDFAVEAWIYPTSTSVNARIVGIGQGANGGGPFTGWSLRCGVDGVISFYRYDGSTETNIAASQSVPSNQWTHVAASRSSGTVRIYVDGTESGSASYSGSCDRINNDDLEIGRVQFGGATFFFSGYIDDLRITKGTSRGYTGSTITIPTSAFQDA